jgi:hypothetical protein
VATAGDNDRYAELRRSVTAIVNAADPIGLLAIECPADEYDPEISRIIPCLAKANSLQDLHEQVYAIFVQMFDGKTAGPFAAYAQIASELWNVRGVG